MPSAISAVIAACQCPAAARPAVPAQEIEENASAKVATRDEVWRRRKCLRLAWVRNQSWISVARGRRDADAGRRDQRVVRRGERHRDDERREHQRDAADHRLDLGADDPACRDRRGGDEIGRVLAGDREPGEAAGELARRHHQHRHQQHEVVVVAAEGAPQHQRRAAADREAASASARRATDRGSSSVHSFRRSAPRGEVPAEAAAPAALDRAAVGDAGGGDGVVAEARREQRRSRRRAAATPALSTAASAVRSPSTARAGHHTTLSIAGHERHQQVGLQEREIRQRAVGQDRGDLQADDEGRADDGGDDLRHEPRPLRPDGAEQRDGQRDRQRRRRSRRPRSPRRRRRASARRRARPAC